MISWCEECYALVSWSPNTGDRVACDGCDSVYEEALSPEELKAHLRDEGVIQFAFAPDQSEAVAAVTAIGPLPRVTAITVLEGFLGTDSLAKMRWGDLNGMLASLPGLREIELWGRLEQLDALPSTLHVLRLCGRVDAQTVSLIGTRPWQHLTTLELSPVGSSLTSLLANINAPALRHLALNEVEVSGELLRGLMRIASQLESLRFTDCWVHEDVESDLGALAPHLSQLREVSVPEELLTPALLSHVPHAE